MIIFFSIMWIIGMWAAVIYNSNNLYITVINEVESKGIKPWTVILLVTGLYFIGWPVIVVLLLIRRLKKKRVKVRIELQFVSNKIGFGFDDGLTDVY